jgi:hypothetical protein
VSIQIITCEQGTPEWHKARLGIPTASKFQTIVAKGRGGGESKGRKEYLYKLAGERLTGEPMHHYQNDHMERGKEMEDEARELYSFARQQECQRVGFIRNASKGCSPDSLIGNDGGLEIKTKLPHLQLEVLDADEVPSEHVAQLQGFLLVTGRQWIDFVSYWPGLKLFVKRVHRDEKYIATLKVAIDEFNDELDALVRKFQ